MNLVVKSAVVVLYTLLSAGIGRSDEVRFGDDTRFTDGSRMMLLGDSFTNGGSDWAAKVRDLPPLEMQFFAEGGRRLDRMASMFADDLVTASSTGYIEAIVIAGGVNDIAGNRTVAEMQQSVGEIVSQSGARHIILTSIPPFKGSATIWTAERQARADQFDVWVHSMASNSVSISLFDIGGILDQDADEIIDSEFAASDNFHPQNCPLGQECGMSHIADSFIQQFSVSAVPEPNSAWAALSGIFWCLKRRRRHRTKSSAN